MKITSTDVTHGAIAALAGVGMSIGLRDVWELITRGVTLTATINGVVSTIFLTCGIGMAWLVFDTLKHQDREE